MKYKEKLNITYRSFAITVTQLKKWNFSEKNFSWI